MQWLGWKTGWRSHPHDAEDAASRSERLGGHQSRADRTVRCAPKVSTHAAGRGVHHFTLQHESGASVITHRQLDWACIPGTR